MRRKVKVFDDLKASLGDALRYEKGQSLDLRVTELPDPPETFRPAEIKRLRAALHASQARFARFLNVSPNTVESWEQGVRKPDNAALKLLSIAKRHPRALLSA